MLSKIKYSVFLPLIAITLAGCERTERALMEDPGPSASQPADTQPADPQPKASRPAARPPAHVAAQAAPQPAIRSIPAQAAARPAPVKTPFAVRRCINLGNTLEAPNEGEWGNRARAADFTIIASAGFDTVRIPVRWDQHMARRAPYAVNPAYMRRVKTVVAQAQSAGLGVILDVHHYDDLLKYTARETPKYLSLWKQISETFAANRGRLYFELLNEPTLDISNDALSQLYAKVLPIIRERHRTRPIIIGGNQWNYVGRLDEIRWPNDPNLIATFHDYGPHEFTHQGASWMNPPIPRGRTWGSKADTAELSETIGAAISFRRSYSRPVFSGEFGVINTVPGAQRAAWLRARRIAYDRANISWCVWDYAGAFSLYDKENRRWHGAELSAVMGR